MNANSSPAFAKCDATEAAVLRVQQAVIYARSKHPRPYASSHEFLGVLLEEVRELMDDIHADKIPEHEAAQIAAVCVRFLSKR